MNVPSELHTITTIMSQPRGSSQKPLINQEKLKKQLEITNFDPNAILRGAQLTVVGGMSWLRKVSIQFTNIL